MAIQRANAMAGKSSRFWVALLNAGGCWKIERRRVRTAIRVNHCLRLEVSSMLLTLMNEMEKKV